MTRAARAAGGRAGGGGEGEGERNGSRERRHPELRERGGWRAGGRGGRK